MSRIPLSMPPGRLGPPHVDYQTPPHPGAPRRPVVDVPLLVLCGLFAVVVGALCYVVMPRMENVFRDFGVQLPMVTVLLLRAARWCTNSHGIVAVWALLMAPPFIVPLIRRWPPANGRRSSRVAFILAVLVLGGLTAWIVLGLFLPYITIAESISSPNK